MIPLKTFVLLFSFPTLCSNSTELLQSFPKHQHSLPLWSAHNLSSDSFAWFTSQVCIPQLMCAFSQKDHFPCSQQLKHSICFYPVVYPDRRHILKMPVLVHGATLQINTYTICLPHHHPTVSDLPPQLDAVFYSSLCS